MNLCAAIRTFYTVVHIQMTNILNYLVSMSFLNHERLRSEFWMTEIAPAKIRWYDKLLKYPKWIGVTLNDSFIQYFYPESY